MTKRLLDFVASDFLSATPMELKQAILASEGRTIMAENVPVAQPYLLGVTNAEIERAAGADLILFNALDVFDPKVVGTPDDISPQRQVQWTKKAVGRAIGVNLEPVDLAATMNEGRANISIGRIASPKTFVSAAKLGFDFVCLTGNPGTGVSNQAILEAIGIAKKYFPGLVMAGKMHGSGVAEEVMNLTIAQEFINAGVDVLLVPAPYTIPHFEPQDLRQITDYVRQYNQKLPIEKKVLVMAANGTSQDSSDEATIRQIGLAAKAAGADLQHIGDSFNGVTLPQNLFTLGEVLRGVRHQLMLLARSNIR